MAGTKAGGKKAAETNKKLHGANFYAEIGRKGGHNGHTGGFASNPELAKIAGAKGGKMSSRGLCRSNRWALTTIAGKVIAEFPRKCDAEDYMKHSKRVPRTATVVFTGDQL